MRAAGIEPAQALRPYGFSYQLRLSPPRLAPSRWSEFVVWTIPSPCVRPVEGVGRRCCPSSLYTFPPKLPSADLARDCHLRGFPDFEQFYPVGFPTGTQFPLKSVASTSFATPANSDFYRLWAGFGQEVFVTPHTGLLDPASRAVEPSWPEPLACEHCRRSVERVLEVDCVVFFDHLDAGRAVLAT